MVMAVPITDDSVRTLPIDQVQVSPSIAAKPGGGYLMAWTDGGSPNYDVYVASLASPEQTGVTGILVNTNTNQFQIYPSVGVLASGNYVVTWTDNSGGGPDPDPSEWSVRGQLFAANGAKIGGEFRVNTTTNLAQWQSEVVPLAGGGFLVEWQNIAPGKVDTRVQIFDASGNRVGGEIIVGDATGTATALPGGGFLSAYSVFVNDGTGINKFYVAAQRFDSAGNKVGGEIRVHDTVAGTNTEVETIALTNGGFVVAWVANGAAGDGDNYGIRAQTFDAAGAPVGGPVTLNQFTAGQQFQLDLTALANGNFAATWSDAAGSGGDGSSYSIKAGVFDASGARVIDEFLVNVKTSSIQQNPTITTLADGRITIAWQDHNDSNPNNGGDYNLRSRTFSVPIAGTEGPDTFTGTEYIDQFVGKGGDDTFIFPIKPTPPGHAPASTWGPASLNDVIEGGAGYDRVLIHGTTSYALQADSLKDVEAIILQPPPAGQMYGSRNFTMHDGNLAAGATMLIDGSALGYGDLLLFYGQKELDGHFTILGGQSNDFLTGGQQSDDITGGLRNDYLRGEGGNDIFRFTGIDEIRGDDIGGGAGMDTMILTGDMSTGALANVQMTGIERMVLNSANGAGYYSYNISIANNMVAAGQTLTVDASALRYGEALMFYGNFEADGNFVILGGASTDVIYGSQNADTIRGGLFRDFLRGDVGNDTFLAIGLAEIRDDDIIGGAGFDTLVLDGDMSAGAMVGVALNGVEAIVLNSAGASGYNAYNLTITNLMVAAGQTLIVDGSALKNGEALMFYGAGEVDGSFVVTGGASIDYIFGSQNGDTIRGGLRTDYIQGNGGADTLVYGSAAESTSVNFDILAGFDRSADRIDLPVAVTGFGSEVNGGQLAAATFDADLAAAMNGVLGSGQAALFNPNSGDYAGRRFLLADGNGQAGYQAGEDYVFELVNPTAPLTGTPDYFV